MKYAAIQLGAFQVNTYLGVEESTGEAFVVDPGTPDERIVSELNAMGMKDLKYILLTHGHFDHILGVAWLKEQFPEAKICISQPDADCLTDRDKTMIFGSTDPFTPVEPDLIVGNEALIPFSGRDFKVLSTPGHTKGSVVYLLDNVMFSGDTLFQKTYGRTDFPGGSLDEMKASLEKLGHLEGDYLVLPGHGPQTYLDFERTHNRYMRKVEW